MIGIIAGSGLTQLSNLQITRREVVRTPYGEPSGALTFGALNGREVVFIARHGYGHTIPPHAVNYRANICHFCQFICLFIIMYYRSMKSSTNDITVSTIFAPVYIWYICIVISLIVSLIVLMYEIYIWIK